jgi:hypothetical protein
MKSIICGLLGMLISFAAIADEPRGVTVINNTGYTLNLLREHLGSNSSKFFDDATLRKNKDSYAANPTLLFNVTFNEKDLGWHSLPFQYDTSNGISYPQPGFQFPGYVCGRVEDGNKVILWERASRDGGSCHPN